MDGQYHDAKIEEINADGEVSVKFKGFRYEIPMLISILETICKTLMQLSRGIFVSTLGLLKLPSSGTTTVHAQVKLGLLQNYQVNGEK